MAFSLRIIYLVMMASVLVACQTPLPKGITPVQATWLYGRHTIPAQYMRDNTNKTWQQSIGDPNWAMLAGREIKSGTKIPVALYLHGCAGLSNEDDYYLNLMLEQGYAVFMPDGFKRPGRRKCSEQGPLWERVDMRTVEVINALKELKLLQWVDQERLILMGFSEGGNTTDNWSRPGFMAHIILGSACTLSGGTPAAPKNIPVLAIVGSNDNYRPGMSCKIERKIGGSRSVVVQGGEHWIGFRDETKTAIKRFLHECCK